jgi:hypothetical protein
MITDPEYDAKRHHDCLVKTKKGISTRALSRVCQVKGDVQLIWVGLEVRQSDSKSDRL